MQFRWFSRAWLAGLNIKFKCICCIIQNLGLTINLFNPAINNRKFPLWAAYVLAYDFIDNFDGNLGTKVLFEKGERSMFYI